MVEQMGMGVEYKVSENNKVKDEGFDCATTRHQVRYGRMATAVMHALG